MIQEIFQKYVYTDSFGKNYRNRTDTVSVVHYLLLRISKILEALPKHSFFDIDKSKMWRCSSFLQNS